MKQTQELFELNPSQEVVLLQTKYTIFKRVINITMSATAEKPLNYQTMLKAFNLAVARNDCTRIRFVKKNGKLLQYFLPEVKDDNMSLSGDIGLDSFGIISMICAIENNFKVSIPEAEMSHFQTLSDLYNYLSVNRV